jgi:hypothetical protein
MMTGRTKHYRFAVTDIADFFDNGRPVETSSQNEVTAADTGQLANGTNGKTTIDLASTETSPEPTDHSISDDGEDDAPLE